MTRNHIPSPRTLLRLLIVVLLYGLGALTLQAQPDYRDAALWYDGGRRLAAGNIRQDTYDVFYVLPTCVFAWEDSTGVRRYNADPLNPSHRTAWALSAELADTIFASGANLFLPYYRQGTFATPNDSVYTAARRIACADVLAAFRHYITTLNQGRPFVLAGFRQGGDIVKELLKAMDDNAYERLIAAYVVGYGVTQQDTLPSPAIWLPGEHKKQHLRPATDAFGRGVTVCYNSVTDTSAVNNSLCGGNLFCINPVSWTTSSTPAVLLPANTAPAADDRRFPYGTAVVAADSTKAVTVRVDQRKKVLVVDNLAVSRYHLPALDSMFPVGNLHLQELFFYAGHLREDVKRRFANGK